MILSDWDIADALERGDITVDPEPEPVQIQPASLDVRIGGELYDPAAGSSTGGLTLPVEEFLLGSTLGRVSLPNDVAALLVGRSTLGRMGVVVHQTAGFIDPGFEGQITLEMYNCSETPRSFEEGDRVAQLVFFRLESPSQGYSGQYQGQTGPTAGGEL